MTAANNVLSQIEANTAAMIANSDEQAEETVEDTTPTTDPDPDVTAPTTPTEPEPSTPTEPAPQEKTITIGGKINAKGAKIYDYAGDKSGENQYFSKDPIYTVLDEKSGYLKVRHHKLSSGVTGWFYVPADFDTIENAFSGAKPPKKAYNKGFRGRFLTSKALFVFIQLECRCQAS